MNICHDNSVKLIWREYNVTRLFFFRMGNCGRDRMSVVPNSLILHVTWSTRYNLQ